MKISFSKMHGIGNDYVYVLCPSGSFDQPERFSQYVSDRRFGIGSDGLVLILPSEIADYRMRIFNADGSEAKMCGNAIRCVGKYLYDRGLTEKTKLDIETNSGIKYLTLFTKDGSVTEVEVDMGKAILEPKNIPVVSDLERMVAQPFTIDGQEYRITCVSMGNPHVISFVEDTYSLPLEAIGPKFEHHSIFPDRVNTEFVQVLSPTKLKMRVWERGSGETFACGTGACAVAVAACLNGFCKQGEAITVQLRGGELTITYQKDGTVLMKGFATHVFDGEIEF